MISRFFIDRPIFAGVLSIIIFLIGGASITRLPVERFPEITPPTVTVRAAYPGANAETVAESLAAPIEQELSGVKDLIYFQSYSGNDGGYSVSASFEIGTDIDLAAVEVQNKLKRAEPRLPQETIRQGIVVEKSSNNMLMVASLKSKDESHDALFLSNYASINMLDTIKRVPGIGNAQVFGGGDYSMRIWIDPDQLTAKGMTVSEVASAIREQNGLYAAGRIGAEPSEGRIEFTLPVVTRGRLKTVEEFEKIVLRANPDGTVLHLDDVAKVELGSQSFDMVGRQDGKPTTYILTYLKSGGNALETVQALRRTMDTLAANMPEGMYYEVPYDSTPFIRIAIEEVAKTFGEAVFLVSLVVLFFLGTWRATLIPLLAVPVAIIGTFGGMLLLGFSVNSLTLFGLVLAIGIVVDDAIIVVENVERLMHEEGLAVREATIRAMEQVTGPIIAIVLVLSSVFLPVGFLGGLTGEMYKQFAVTIAISVTISGIVALTLSPALCALLLKPHDEKFIIFRWFDQFFAFITRGYTRVVRQSIRFGFITMMLFAAMLWTTWDLFKKTPSGFIPQEDQGFFIVAVLLPPGASIDRTVEVAAQVEEFLLQQPEVRHAVTLAGVDFLAGWSSASNSALMFVPLKTWDERKRPDQHVDALVGKMYGRFGGLKEGLVLAFNPPPVMGLGLRAGFEYQLQSRTGGDVRELAETMQMLQGELAKRPELQNIRASINVSQPQLFLDVDRARAKLHGVAINDIYDTLQALLGSLYVNDFSRFGRIHRVQLQAIESARNTPQSIERVFVRNRFGEMVPLSGIVETRFQSGPNVVTRFNGFPSVQFTGEPAPGFSTGDAIRIVEEVSAKALPQGYGFEWSGASYQEIKAGKQAPLVIGFGLVMVFLVLAAQYEKWTLPFAVLLGIPSGAFGAIIAIGMRDISKDIYFQIGLLALIGLAAKNAILIVEFASVLHEKGRTLREAAIEAARVRLRPFVMTSLAFIFGVLPLAISTGAGAAGRHSIGTSVMGGMIAATFLDMFFVPLFFYLVEKAGGLFRRRSPEAASAMGGSGHPDLADEDVPQAAHT